MKTHRPTTHRRKRRAADEAAPVTGHEVETEALPSPAQSLDVLRDPQASQVACGAAALDLQRSLGNTHVARLLALRQEVDESEEATKTCLKRTKKQAQKMVPAHVEPKECFVWMLNSCEGWGPIPGTGCAHWIAHEMGISGGAQCDQGYSVRVRDVIAGKTKFPLAKAQVGDIWENPTDASHVGIVREVKADAKTGDVTEVKVQHDSSRQGGVVTSWFSTGDFYR